MKNLNLIKQEREYLTISRIVLTLVFSIISIIAAVSYFLASSSEIKMLVIFQSIIWVFYGLIYLYQGAAYRRFSYAMNKHGLFIYRGVIWRKKIVVPINRVQHTDVTQGPLERKFDLAELVVHTAGTRNASVKLPGIMHEDAEKLRESLSFLNSDDAV